MARVHLVDQPIPSGHVVAVLALILLINVDIGLLEDRVEAAVNIQDFVEESEFWEHLKISNELDHARVKCDPFRVVGGILPAVVDHLVGRLIRDHRVQKAVQSLDHSQKKI